jgi:hypothetical protein
MGNKKGKAQRNGATSSRAMDASLHIMIAEVVANTKKRYIYIERDDKNDARWNALLTVLIKRSRLRRPKLKPPRSLPMPPSYKP